MAQQLLTLTEIRTLLARQADNNGQDGTMADNVQYYDDKAGLISLEPGKVFSPISLCTVIL